jgi:RP/EB family microtubule-associated protein
VSVCLIFCFTCVLVGWLVCCLLIDTLLLLFLTHIRTTVFVIRLFPFRTDYEYVANYKLLQVAFSKHHVQRYVDVDKLIRAKYQDNLEFCQWLKAFYDQSGAFRPDYDASAVREKGKGGKKYNDSMSSGSGSSKGGISRSNKPVGGSAGGRTAVASPIKASASSSTRAGRVTSTTAASAVRPQPQRPTGTRSSSTNNSKTPLTASENKTRPTTTTTSQSDSQILKRNIEMENRLKELEVSVAEIEKERDFYFGKLRNVELLLQVRQDKGWEDCNLEDVVDGIFKVLYATADEDIAVDEDGEVREKRDTATICFGPLTSLVLYISDFTLVVFTVIAISSSCVLYSLLIVMLPSKLNIPFSFGRSFRFHPNRKI